MVGRTGKKTKTAKPATAGGRRAFTNRNGEPEYNINLVKEYEVFLETLEDHIRRIGEQQAEEMRLLDVQEEEFFQRTCNLYTAEQLDMPAAVLQKFLEEEDKAKLQLANEESVGDHHDVPADEPVIFRIPIKPIKKKRRSSAVSQYNSVAATPIWRASRANVPTFMAKGTGIKNSKPRPARLGELAFSDNGSPIMVMPSAKLKIPIKKGKMVLADDV